jgi:hypothetical protein
VTSDGLCAALKLEQKSSAALQLQVSELQKQMEALEGIALVTAKTYKVAVEKYGGTTSTLPSEATPFNLLSWLKTHVEKFSSIMGGVADFRALVGVTNFGKMLVRKGCTHATALECEALSDASSLGETSDELRKSTRNFMQSFWTLFGRASAKHMAEEVRAKVSPLTMFPILSNVALYFYVATLELLT